MSKAKRYYTLVNIEPKSYIPKVGSHRFVLSFKAKRAHGGKSVAIIQMNGSETGFTEYGNDWDIDPTIGKVLTWCYENVEYPFEMVYCLNLFSYVDPYPENLTHLELNTLNNLENDYWIKKVCACVDYIILAYGDCDGINPDVAMYRINEVLSWFENIDLNRVGNPNKSGSPKHGRGWNNNPSMQLHRQAIRID